MREETTVQTLFIRGWTLLEKNWFAFLPAVLIALVTGGLAALLIPRPVAGETSEGIAASAIIWQFVFTTFTVVSSLLTVFFTTGPAEAMWRTGRATPADILAPLRTDWLRLAQFVIVWIFLGMAAGALGPVTLFFSLVVFWFITLFAMAAFYLGGMSVLDALTESFNVVTNNPVNAGLIVAALVCFRLLALFCGGLVSEYPVLSVIVSMLLTDLFVVYATVVVVGDYRTIRASSLSKRQPDK